jgi:hypothetical protein
LQESENTLPSDVKAGRPQVQVILSNMKKVVISGLQLYQLTVLFVAYSKHWKMDATM